ncbi:MAG: hypothetical protein WC718_16515 [Phycisphaerales bacterium]|jgi:4-hydroxybenzoate polyprenyltransferase
MAAWPALYVASAVVYLAQLSGVWRLLPAPVAVGLVGMAFFAAIGTYLLDRVKLRDAWLDPADAMAQPKRYAFLTKHTRACRVLMIASLAAAAALGAWLTPWLAAVPLLSASGVVLYAGKPKGKAARPKDVLIIKNAYVAAGIVGFAALLLAGAQGHGSIGAISHEVFRSAFIFGMVTLGLRVAADAVLCDLDDQRADATFGTETLPTRFGRDSAWKIAFFARLGTAAVLVAVPLGPLPSRLAWAACTIVSSVWLRAAAPESIRDWVDSRFAIEAIAATVLAMLA